MLNRRYSIYSIKNGGERRARGISELRGQESTPWTHKSFIYKQGLISQAGRRGFEPRLPLQILYSEFEKVGQSVSGFRPLVSCPQLASPAGKRVRILHRCPTSGQPPYH